MATKKNYARPADDERAAPEREDRHAQLQAERRVLETELAALDDSIRTAITSGDAAGLERFTARKAELPGLFMAASLAETNARHEVFNAEDKANSEMLDAALIERDELQAALVSLRARHAEELAALTAELQSADQKVNSLYANIGAARNLGAANDAGFRRSLAKLAGV